MSRANYIKKFIDSFDTTIKSVYYLIRDLNSNRVNHVAVKILSFFYNLPKKLLYVYYKKKLSNYNLTTR